MRNIFILSQLTASFISNNTNNIRPQHYPVYVTDEVCVFVGHTGELSKTDEPIEMPFGADSLGPKKLVIDGNPDLAQGKGQI